MNPPRRKEPSRGSDRPRGGATGLLRHQSLQLFLQGPVDELELGALRERPAPEGEAARLAFRLDVACIEPGRVGAHGAHADGDRIRGGAQLVHAATALLPGHPALARHGHAPVERHRGLVGDEGRPSAIHVRHASFCRRARTASSPSATSTSTPPASRPAKPCLSVFGLGSGAPTTTRAMPAARIASTQGAFARGGRRARASHRGRHRALARPQLRARRPLRAARPHARATPLPRPRRPADHHGPDDGIRVRRVLVRAPPARARAQTASAKAFTSCR